MFQVRLGGRGKGGGGEGEGRKKEAILLFSPFSYSFFYFFFSYLGIKDEFLGVQCQDDLPHTRTCDVCRGDIFNRRFHCGEVGVGGGGGGGGGGGSCLD